MEFNVQFIKLMLDLVTIGEHPSRLFNIAPGSERNFRPSFVAHNEFRVSLGVRYGGIVTGLRASLCYYYRYPLELQTKVKTKVLNHLTRAFS